jgi:hypothetical protein
LTHLLLLGRERGEEVLDELAVLRAVEVLLHDLAGAGDGEIDCLATELGDRLVALRRDVAAGALSISCWSPRVFSIRSARDFSAT